MEARTGKEVVGKNIRFKQESSRWDSGDPDMWASPCLVSLLSWHLFSTVGRKEIPLHYTHLARAKPFSLSSSLKWVHYLKHRDEALQGIYPLQRKIRACFVWILKFVVRLCSLSKICSRFFITEYSTRTLISRPQPPTPLVFELWHSHFLIFLKSQWRRHLWIQNCRSFSFGGQLLTNMLYFC